MGGLDVFALPVLVALANTAVAAWVILLGDNSRFLRPGDVRRRTTWPESIPHRLSGTGARVEEESE